MKRTFRIVSFALITCIPAAATTTYTITQLPLFPSFINNSGQIAGTIGSNAYLYSGGTLTQIGIPGANGTVLGGMNNLGQVVGQSLFLGQPHPFLFSGGVTTDLSNVLGGATLFGINDTGQIAGNNSIGAGFLYSNGTVTPIIGVSGFSINLAAINNSGQMTGSGLGLIKFDGTECMPDLGDSRAILYSGGTVKSLGLPFGCDNSYGFAINNHGQVAGTSGDDNNVRVFFYDGANDVVEPSLGGIFNNVGGMNDSGVIVGDSNLCGNSFLSCYYQHVATLYSSGTVTDLNTLLAPGSGWVLTGARGINNSGVIAGSGTLNGNFQGFLLTPMTQTPPTLTCAANPNSLWPPNGSAVPVDVNGIVIPGSSSLANDGTTYAVTDEYGLDQPSGSFTVGQGGAYTFSVTLTAARNGNDQDGRTYTILVTVKDAGGLAGTCTTVITVPHDQGHGNKE